MLARESERNFLSSGAQYREIAALFTVARSTVEAITLQNVYAAHCCFVVGCGLIIRGTEPAAQNGMPAQLLLSHISTASHCHCGKRGASTVPLTLVRPVRSFSWLNNNTAH